MAAANVSVPGEVLPDWGGLTSHQDTPRAYQVSHFSPKDCALFFLAILGCFLKWVNLCMGPLRAGFFPLCLTAFLGVFPTVVNSQQSQILWHVSQLYWVQRMLIAVTVRCSGPPLLQGRLCTLGLLQAIHEVSQLVKIALFLSRKEFLPLPHQAGLSLVVGVLFILF